MAFDLWGFTSALYFSPPAGFHGYALVAAYAALTLVALAFGLRSFLRLSLRQWLACIGLTLAGFVLAQLFILRIPANILPPPGLPAEPHRPGFALFALLPAFLAAGWLGGGPALVVGLATGVSRAAWETYSLATPFEYALVAAACAWCLRQRYWGWPGRLLRHPVLAGAGIGLVAWLSLALSYLAYSPTVDLPAWDYIWSRTAAAAPVFSGQIILAGLLAEFVRLGLPGLWPPPQELVPPPYVSSLNRKLLFSLAPVYCVGIALLLWANITVATRVSTGLVVDQMANAAEAAGRGIPYFAATGQSQLSSIATQQDWMGLPEPAQTAALARSLRSMPFFRQLTLLGADLHPVAAYPADPADLPAPRAAETQLAQHALAGIPENVTLYPEQAGQAVDVIFAAPVFSGTASAPAGVIIGHVDLGGTPLMQSVTSSLRGLAGGAGQGFIVDEYGVIIYATDAARVRETFEPEAAGTPLPTRLDNARAYQDKALDGTRRLVLYYPVPGHPWAVVTMVPNHVVLAQATEIARPIVIILLLLGTIGLLLVSMLAGRVTQPATALAQAAQHISEGHLDRPVVVGGEDEIGRAGLAFERMRQRLRDRLEELSLLLRVSQQVAASLNLDEALPPILEAALSATGAAGGRIVLAAPEPAPAVAGLGSALPVAVPACTAGPAAALMAALDRGVLALTRDEGAAVIDNLARARAVLDVTPVLGQLHAVLALPLRHETNYLGAVWLAFDRPHTFSEAEVNFLTTLAGQAAVAVINARLFEAAEHGRQRLAAILASTPDAVIVTDRNERVLLVNPAAEAAFELGGAAVIGRPVAQVLRDPELVRLLQDHRVDAPPQAGEVQVSSGRTLYASASTIISADGVVQGRVCVLRDVTHFKHLDQMKSEFVATVSHDLRAPLTFMRGYATMLPMVGPLNEKQREFGEKIISGIEQMTVLIDDLLDLGRIEAGVGVAREPVWLNSVVDEVVQTLAPQAANKGLRLQVEVPAALPALSGDALLLRQAVTNLLDNAIKYTLSGGDVRVRAAAADGEILLTVADTGVGIAPADQAHLFEKFFRVRQRGSTQVKGSGLGLAIVKSIAESHGGRVWVDSRLGRGSTFYLAVPLPAAAPAATAAPAVPVRT
jgi:PAS domain S-box-containing protein